MELAPHIGKELLTAWESNSTRHPVFPLAISHGPWQELILDNNAPPQQMWLEVRLQEILRGLLVTGR